MSVVDLGTYDVNNISYTSGATNFVSITVTSQGILQYLSGTTATVQLKGITDPVDPQDAATKIYVDNLSYGLSWKQPAYLYAIGDISVTSAPSTFDAESPYADARILVAEQSSSIENGIYTWTTAGVPLVRTPDFPTGGDLQEYSGSALFVQAGATAADQAYVETADTGIIGTDPVIFVQFSSSGGAAAGTAEGQIQFRGITPGSFAASAQFMFTQIPVTTVNTFGVGTVANSNAEINFATGGFSNINSGTQGLENTFNMGTTDFRIISDGTDSTVISTGPLLLSTTGTGYISVTANSTSGTPSEDFLGTSFRISSQTFVDNSLIDFTTKFIFNSVSYSVLGSTTDTITETVANLYVAQPIAATSQTFVNNYSIWAEGTMFADHIIATSATFDSITATSATFTEISVTSIIGGAASPTNGVQYNGGSNTFAATDSFLFTLSGTDGTIDLGNVASSQGTINIGTQGLVLIGGDVDGSITNGSGVFSLANAADQNVNLFNTTTTGDITIGSAMTTGNINITTGATSVVTIWSTVASTSRDTGALVVKGGLGVALDAYATRWRTVSDMKYKTNIEPIDDPLNILKRIEGYSYNWKPDFIAFEEDNYREYGVLAQQVEQEGIAGVVSGIESKTVNYSSLIPIIIEALKELNNKVSGSSESRYKFNINDNEEQKQAPKEQKEQKEQKQAPKKINKIKVKKLTK